ncbi:hypothetical protein WH87_04695 [Devosia epidermidihirudinis]|uniref:Tip attachment protein J domain-containing protein n=1 Tax=Devosia epidermidihirudinis TaxID=1293439 RepID=A0A0F5QEV9_9HYPH|nr:hypothetical protein [Devosia epidermidihirudinis]KKC39500.1 hypothetical protein WH87_04695 [Devosia epidermidihirudinis]
MNFIIQFVVGIVLSLASSLFQQATAQKQQKATGTRGSAQVGGKVPQYFLMGTVGEPGKFEYGNSWGEANGVPNAYSVDVYSFGDLAINDMVGLFVNATRVPLTTAGAVEQGNPVTLKDDGGQRRLWWKFLNGSQIGSDAYLTSKFGADPDRPWTGDMVGRGLPLLITTSLWDEKLWTGFPSFVGEFQGIKLYDITKDSTAGGSGPQRWENPSTWAFSDNNAVMIYNIERGIYYNPPKPDGSPATTLGKKIWGGSSTAAQLPYAVWAAAINACNENVSLVSGGTEKRFRAGRKINLNERPADVIRELLVGANARYCPAADGTKYILVGVPTVADFAFSDADVLATERLGAIPFPNLDDIINGATATYREPTQAWEDKETAPYIRADLEAEDDGRPQPDGFAFDTTFSGTQAQRLLKAIVEESRRFKTHVAALPPEFGQYRPLMVGAWTSERFGYVNKLFLITVRTRDIWGNVVFGLHEIDPADHNWNPTTDQRPLSFAPVVTNRPAPQAVVGFSVAPAIGNDSQGRPRRPGYDAFWSSTSVAVDVDFVRISHRLKGETTNRWVGLIPRPELLTGSARVLDSLLQGEVFEVQIQYVTNSGRRTLASGWLEVIIPDVKLNALDVELDDLANEIGDKVAELEDWARHNTRETIEEKRKAILLNVQGAVGDFNDRQIIRRETSSETANNRALFREEILTATGPNSAIVARIEELRAEVFDPVSGLPATTEIVNLLSAEVHHPTTGLEAIGNSILSLTSSVAGQSAEGLFRIFTAATPEGASARVALSVAASGGAAPNSAAMYLDAMTDGKSRILMVADQIGFTNGTSLENPFVFEGGVLTMRATRVQTITAGVLQSPDGKMVINLNAKRIAITT